MDYRKKFPLVAVFFTDTAASKKYQRAIKIFEAHWSIFGMSHCSGNYEVGLQYGVPASNLKACIAKLKRAGFEVSTDCEDVDKRFAAFLINNGDHHA